MKKIAFSFYIVAMSALLSGVFFACSSQPEAEPDIRGTTVPSQTATVQPSQTATPTVTAMQFEQYLDIASDPSADVSHRIDAARALGDLGNPLAVETLIAMVKEPDNNVRMSAAEALGKLGDKRAVDALVALLMDNTLSNEDRAIIGEALGKIGDANAATVIIDMLRKETDIPSISDPRVIALSKMGECAVDPLISALKDRNYVCRACAAYALGEIRDEKAVDALIPLLRDREYDVYHYTISALGKIRGEKAFQALLSYINTKGYFDTGAMVWLEEFNDPRAVDPIIKVLKTNRDYNMRSWAANVLGDIKDERAIEPLIAAMGDADVSGCAANALMKYSKGFDIMLTASGDKSSTVRREAGRQLSYLDDDRAVQRLLEAYEAGDLAVIAGSCSFFIGEGKAGTEDILIAALNKYGDYITASWFLNCGNEDLEKAAEKWAESHGYVVSATFSGITGTQWGQGH